MGQIRIFIRKNDVKKVTKYNTTHYIYSYGTKGNSQVVIVRLRHYALFVRPLYDALSDL